MKTIKDQSQNKQHIMSGKIVSRIYNTYKNYVIENGRHIYKTLVDMDIATMCDFPSNQHALSHYKFVLHCC